jgi:hypothetical protein
VTAPTKTASPTLETVKLASGQAISVQGKEERTWFNRTRDKYQSENRFTVVTDIQDLDQLLIAELMIHRWTLWMSSGRDYDGNIVAESEFQKPLREYSTLVGNIKTRMGLSKAERDKENNDSVGAYLIRLKAAAKQFGVHREKQLTKALVLMNELSTLVGAFDRSDETERAKIGIESEKDIVEWVRETMLPEFREIDEHFRRHTQRYFVGTV